MKVGYILNTYPCRSETFVAREIRYLRNWSLDITVFAAAGDGPVSEGEPGGRAYYRPSRLSMRALGSLWLALIRYPFGICRLLGLVWRLSFSCPREARSLLGNVHTICRFAQYLEREGITHIHAYFFSWPAVIGLGLSAVTGCTFSVGAHARDIFVEHGDIALKVSRARFVVVCTEQGVQHLRARLAPAHHGRLVLNYHGVEVNGVWSPGSRGVADDSNPLIVAVGRFVPKKGFDRLVEAFSDIVKHRPGSRLILVGDGPERENLGRLVEAVGLEDSVQWMGWQDPRRARYLIGQATVLVVPSLIAADGDRDGIPNVVLEAFAAGTPVVAADLPAIAEAVEHGRTGLLVRSGDVSAISAAVQRLLEDKLFADGLSRNAYVTVRERFRVEDATRRLAGLFLGADGCRCQR